MYTVGECVRSFSSYGRDARKDLWGAGSDFLDMSPVK